MAARNDNAIKVTEYARWSEFLIRPAFPRCTVFVSFISGATACFIASRVRDAGPQWDVEANGDGDDSNKSGQVISRLETYRGKRSDATFGCFISG